MNERPKCSITGCDNPAFVLCKVKGFEKPVFVCGDCLINSPEVIERVRVL